MLGIAGPITDQKTSAVVPGLNIGDTIFFAIQDNGEGGPGQIPDRLADGSVPAMFGPLTIQQIFVLFFGSQLPPPETYRSVLSGNLKVF